MPNSHSIFYVLTYPERRELRAGVCTDWPALRARIEREYMLMDLETSLIAPVSPEATEGLRTAVHSWAAPTYAVTSVEDAYFLTEDSVIRKVLRQRKVISKRLSTVLQTEGENREEWRMRSRHLRQAKYWQAYCKDAKAKQRENERALQRAEEFVSGLQTHAEEIYVSHRIEVGDSESQPDSLDLYAVASTAVGAARLSTYIEARKDHGIAQFGHPRGGFSFLTGSTFSNAPERAFYIQSVSASFRRYPQMLAPHVAAGLEAVLYRLCAHPLASTKLREDAEALQKRLWDRLSGDFLSDPPPDTLS